MNKGRQLALRDAVKARMRFIEQSLFLAGQIGRNDVATAFGLSSQQGTNDLLEYRRMNPRALKYDPARKIYLAGKDLKLLFWRPTLESLIIQMQTNRQGAGLPTDSVRVPVPESSVAASRNLYTAVRLQRSVEFAYVHPSGKSAPVQMTPTAFLHDGLNWMVRGWCGPKAGYKDFVIARINKLSVQRLSTKIPPDDRWAKMVAVKFARPNEKRPAGTVKTRAALVPYLEARMEEAGLRRVS